ncbi:MAG: hypothetical protein JWQ94_1433 [Tardiphaga sp.]|nr:hypothetical protein [Tardiphaga sp.]
MTRFLLLLPLVLFAFAASAQSNQAACARDVTRFCRAKMDGGDMVVLSCLKENRTRLGKACAKVLADNGQ